MLNKYILVILLCLAYAAPSYALPDDNPPMQEVTNDPNIRTIQFTRAGTGQSNTYPIIRLNSGDSVSLQFDVLGTDPVKNYQFTVVHCEADWRRSQMLQSDYINGLFSDYASSFGFSSATYIKYTHYKVNFPSSNMQVKVSGDYMLVVYLDNPDKPVITRRFYVYEKDVNITGTALRATYTQYMDTKQEINFTINTAGLTLIDPFTEIKTTIKQNWRWDNEITNLKPTYVRNQSLIYDYQDGNVFDAGNEFRPFDIRDLRYKGIGVRSFSFDSIYNVYLYPDEDRSYTAYSVITDQDGNFTITDNTNGDASTTGDYAMVHFKLSPTYVDDGSGNDIYVFGALSDWQLEKRFKMEYNPKYGYECNVLLKQGFYDYEYVRVKDGKLDPSEFEGNHWETENTYTVFVYYHPPSALGDLLIAVLRLNTGLGK